MLKTHNPSEESRAAEGGGATNGGAKERQTQEKTRDREAVVEGPSSEGPT